VTYPRLLRTVVSSKDECLEFSERDKELRYLLVRKILWNIRDADLVRRINDNIGYYAGFVRRVLYDGRDDIILRPTNIETMTASVGGAVAHMVIRLHGNTIKSERNRGFRRIPEF
jgi:hypothetical protein